jgi:hypothetical protein
MRLGFWVHVRRREPGVYIANTNKPMQAAVRRRPVCRKG